MSDSYIVYQVLGNQPYTFRNKNLYLYIFFQKWFTKFVVIISPPTNVGGGGGPKTLTLIWSYNNFSDLECYTIKDEEDPYDLSKQFRYVIAIVIRLMIFVKDRLSLYFFFFSKVLITHFYGFKVF